MANQEQLEILMQGVDVWNKWRKEHSELEIDLYDADLRGVMLRKIDLSRANLTGTDFINADLSEARLIYTDFRSANLSGANLNGANLTRADLSRAILSDAKLLGTDLTYANLKNTDFSNADLRDAELRDANFSGADLSKTNFSYANLTGANFNNAILNDTNFTNGDIGFTIFGDVDFGTAIGLKIINHRGPTTIGSKTIQRSKGKIPTEFLRGCGLSDLDIEYAKLAVPGLDPEEVTDITYGIHQLYLGDGIQYYSCFISYNSKDQILLNRLHDDLQDNGVRCWFAPEDMKIGDQIRPTIDRQIQLRDKLLVILSKNSVHSEWVGDEVEAAIEEEKESERLVLFPIRLDDAVLNTREDWAAKIKRRRHIGDFSNWKDESAYRKAFERLLRDLKATGNQ